MYPIIIIIITSVNNALFIVNACLLLFPHTHSMAASLPDPDIELDGILCSVADAIAQDDQIDRLGRRLGVKPAVIQRCIQTNHKGPTVTAEGTKDMLRQWSSGKSVSEALPALRAALTEAGLVQIAEKYVPGSLSSEADGMYMQMSWWFDIMCTSIFL